MNTSLPNIDRSASVKEAGDARKTPAKSREDGQEGKFTKVIERVNEQSQRKPSVKEDKNSAPVKAGNKAARSDEGEAEQAPSLKDLIKQAGTEAATVNSESGVGGAKSGDTSVLPAATEQQGDAGDLGKMSGELALRQLMASNTAITGQGTKTQLSSVTGLINSANAAVAGGEGTMAQVLNALNTKQLKAGVSEGSGKTAALAEDGDLLKQQGLSGQKAEVATAKLDTATAVNLPKTGADLIGAKQPTADLMLKQNLTHATASTAGSQTAEAKQVGAEVKVVSIETHLPPAELGRPAQQVANVLAKSLGQGPTTPKAPVEQPMQLADASAAKAVKSLEIQLRPDNLGVVRANIQMRGGELEISLITRTQDAADMLKSDRHALARVLQDAGYRTESQNITVSFKDDMSEQMRQSGQNQDQRFGKGNNSDAERGEGGSQQDWEEQASADYSGTGKNESDTQDLRSGIYL